MSNRQYWWQRQNRWTRGRRFREAARDNYSGTWWAARDQAIHEARTARRWRLADVARHFNVEVRWFGLEAWVAPGRVRRRLVTEIRRWAARFKR